MSNSQFKTGSAISRGMDQSLFNKRKRVNAIGLSLSVFAMSIGMFFLIWILSILLYKGFSALSLSLFLESTPAPGTDGGGLANPIVGSLMIVGACTFISTPIGILAGIYLSEYGSKSKFAEVTRFVTDIMLSAPSIVIGLFVYAIIGADCHSRGDQDHRKYAAVSALNAARGGVCFGRAQVESGSEHYLDRRQERCDHRNFACLSAG